MIKKSTNYVGEYVMVEESSNEDSTIVVGANLYTRVSSDIKFEHRCSFHDNESLYELFQILKAIYEGGGEIEQ